MATDYEREKMKVLESIASLLRQVLAELKGARADLRNRH